MARCYLTGVEISLEDAYVLHRGAVHRHLAALKDRAASLQRLVAQLSPLDDSTQNFPGKPPGKERAARRQHRLICKTMAEALGPAYPDIQLFMRWPEYRAKARDALRPQTSPPAARERPPHAGDEPPSAVTSAPPAAGVNPVPPVQDAMAPRMPPAPDSVCQQ